MAKRSNHWAVVGLLILALAAVAFAAPPRRFNSRLVGNHPRVNPVDHFPGGLKDTWMGRDKAKHFMAGTLLTLQSFWFLHQQCNSKFSTARTSATLLTGAVSLLKEIGDARSPENHFCKKDLVMDLLGIGAGLVLINNTTWDK